jgi:hypothetical protein
VTVTSAACRTIIAGDDWRTVDDVCRALRVTTATEKARVTSALSHDAQRGLAESRVVARYHGRPINAYRLRRDALPRSTTCRMAAEARHGGPMRPVLRDLCIAAMQSNPNYEWSTSDVAKSISRTPNGIRGVMEMLHNELLLARRDINRVSYIEIRWHLTDAGKAVQVKAREPVKVVPRVPDRWPGRDHEALEQAWPHQVTVPEGGMVRVHTMAGGWV